ncbi:hypothetical protein C8J57DRAFT_1223944 [Mycena rebaudengoi]|nr:hypothetical protein C8J57DRAFT_1223944 [Mycena rebaudengoi]
MWNYIQRRAILLVLYASFTDAGNRFCPLIPLGALTSSQLSADETSLTCVYEFLGTGKSKSAIATAFPVQTLMCVNPFANSTFALTLSFKLKGFLSTFSANGGQPTLCPAALLTVWIQRRQKFIKLYLDVLLNRDGVFYLVIWNFRIRDLHISKLHAFYIASGAGVSAPHNNTALPGYTSFDPSMMYRSGSSFQHEVVHRYLHALLQNALFLEGTYNTMQLPSEWHSPGSNISGEKLQEEHDIIQVRATTKRKNADECFIGILQRRHGTAVERPGIMEGKQEPGMAEGRSGQEKIRATAQKGNRLPIAPVHRATEVASCIAHCSTSRVRERRQEHRDTHTHSRVQKGRECLVPDMGPTKARRTAAREGPIRNLALTIWVEGWAPRHADKCMDSRCSRSLFGVPGIDSECGDDTISASGTAWIPVAGPPPPSSATGKYSRRTLDITRLAKKQNIRALWLAEESRAKRPMWPGSAHADVPTSPMELLHYSFLAV